MCLSEEFRWSHASHHHHPGAVRISIDIKAMRVMSWRGRNRPVWASASVLQKHWRGSLAPRGSRQTQAWITWKNTKFYLNCSGNLGKSKCWSYAGRRQDSVPHPAFANKIRINSRRVTKPTLLKLKYLRRLPFPKGHTEGFEIEWVIFKEGSKPQIFGGKSLYFF